MSDKLQGGPAKIVYQATLDTVGYEDLTVSTTAVGLASIPDNAVRCVIQVQEDSIRVKSDGTDPTASSGVLFVASATASPPITTFFEITGQQDIKAFKAIRDVSAGGDAVLAVTYEGVV